MRALVADAIGRFGHGAGQELLRSHAGDCWLGQIPLRWRRGRKNSHGLWAISASTSFNPRITGVGRVDWPGVQNQIGAAGNLIGKSVQGIDDNLAPVSGIVTSVSVVNSAASLNLDNGKSLAMANVTQIAGATTNTAVAGAPATTPTTPNTAG